MEWGRYNVRSLLSLERILELKQVVSKIYYDIISLAEGKRRRYNREEDRDNIFCYFGERKDQYGVSFLIKKYLKENIDSFTVVSARICALYLNLRNISLFIIQVYTIDSNDLGIKVFTIKYKTI